MSRNADLSSAHEQLLASFLQGKRPALARVISIVEDGRPGFEAMLSRLHARLGRAQRIGITGPPGAGKSTLTSALIRLYRGRGERVAVVAVDPTSPFTGGALLGDRIRMNDVAMDDGVFIRSMATRGSLGGLAVSTQEVADVVDAFGFDRIVIETVGVGQSELDIAGTADSTVVVLVPESGDSIQAMKAGLMEVGDLFVINKADRPGADRLARDVELMIHLRFGRTGIGGGGHHGVNLRVAARKAAEAERAAAEAKGETPEWTIPVLSTVAESGKGVEELAEVLDRHHVWLDETGELTRRRQARLGDRVRDVVQRDLLREAWLERGGRDMLEDSLGDLENGTATPYDVAARIVRAALR